MMQPDSPLVSVGNRTFSAEPDVQMGTVTLFLNVVDRCRSR